MSIYKQQCKALLPARVWTHTKYPTEIPVGSESNWQQRIKHARIPKTLELDRGIDKRINMRLTNFVWMSINGPPRDERIVRFMLKVEAEWEHF